MFVRSLMKCAAIAAFTVVVGALPARAMPFHDVYIMLDNSGSLGQANFDAQKQAAINLVQDYGGNPNNPMRFSIIDFATSSGIDCIVIGSHRPGLSDYFLGSTASRVVRHAPCAVHVFRE